MVTSKPCKPNPKKRRRMKKRANIENAILIDNTMTGVAMNLYDFSRRSVSLRSAPLLARPYRRIFSPPDFEPISFYINSSKAEEQPAALCECAYDSGVEFADEEKSTESGKEIAEEEREEAAFDSGSSTGSAEDNPIMAPQQRARPLPKPAFASAFSKLKTTTYPDVPSRGSTGHSMRTLAWNALGTLVATGMGDRNLRIWNPEKSNIKFSTELKGHQGSIERVAFNPTMEAELASCGADGTVKFWDVRSKASVGEVKIATGKESKELLTLAWKPDGSEVVVGTKDDILFPISRSTLMILGSYRQGVQTNQTMFSWSGKELLLTTGDGHVKILDYASMSNLHTIKGHTSSCLSLDISPTGSYIAVGGSDALLTLWDTDGLYCKHSLAAIPGPVRSVGFSFDGSYVVGGSDEGNGIEIAHVETGDYVYKVETNHPVSCVQWHPSRYVLAYGGSGGALKIIGAMG